MILNVTSKFVYIYSRIQQFMHAGLIDKWFRTSYHENDCQRQRDSHHPLGLTHTKSAFLILFIGVGLALGALIIELSCRKNRH